VQGLHKQQNEMPLGMTKIFDTRAKYKLIHRGFATDEQILKRYRLYKGLGQEGWELNRLLDEASLKVAEVPLETLPAWFEPMIDTHPNEKILICELATE